jgi:hypothetical protein
MSDEDPVMRAINDMEARLNDQLVSMNAEIVNLRSDMDRGVEKLTKRVDGLKQNIIASMSLTPAGIVTMNEPKVAPADEDDALVEGTAATFTFVQCKVHKVRSFFAIGSCHCAFYFKALGDKTFVFLPESVAAMEVSRVYYHPRMCHPCITDTEDT